MNRQRFLWLVIAAVVVLAGALYLSARRNTAAVSVGGPLLPKLEPVANSVTAVTIRHASATPTATVHQQDGKWMVSERADYPADVSKVRKLVVALTDAKIVEEKTSDPAKFASIGVDDPSTASATGTEITLTAKDGKHTVLVGKTAGEGNFVRRGGENTSYIVEPSVSVETDPKYWIDTAVVDIPTANIQSVELKPASGPGYALRRPPPAPAAAAAATATAAGAPGTSPPTATPSPAAAPGAAPAAAAGFTLQGVPAGRKAAEAASLAPSPSTLSGLTAEDVLQASNVDFTKPTVATFTLADGSTLTVTGASSGDKHWIELKSSKDTALDVKAAGRAFEIPAYRYDAIFRPLDQLLVPREPPPSAKGKDAGPIPMGPTKPKSSPAQ